MAVSIVSPACSALTSPDSSTLAIFLSEECHTRVRLAFASASNVTDNRSLCPISSESVFLFKRMPRISSASEREEAISVFPYNRLPPEAVPSRGCPAVPCQTFSPFSPATQENTPESGEEAEQEEFDLEDLSESSEDTEPVECELLPEENETEADTKNYAEIL